MVGGLSSVGGVVDGVYLFLFVTLVTMSYRSFPMSRSKLLVAAETRYCIDGFSLCGASRRAVGLNGTCISAATRITVVCIGFNAPVGGI